MPDFNARFAAVRARRAEAGLIADNGVACATRSDLAYQNAKHAARETGRRDPETTARLVMLKALAVAAHGKGPNA